MTAPRVARFLSFGLLCANSAAFAQAHMHMPGMAMPGMAMPPQPARAPAKKVSPKRRKPAASRTQSARPLARSRPAAPPSPMPAMDMSASEPHRHAEEPAGPGSPAGAMDHGAKSMSGGGHSEHDMGTMAAMPAEKSGTDRPPGAAEPPPVQPGRPADHYYDPKAMAAAEADLLGSHGGMIFHRFVTDIAEVQVRRGRDAYRWDSEFWLGGDTDRLVLKSEGEAARGDRVESAELQALYSRALDPYWNLQAGIRQDFRPQPARTYAVVGLEGTAPYWIGIDGALFLSDRGDLLGRVTASYDQRITQRLILQPRAELNLAAQDMDRARIGAGLSTAELGVRLRYEIVREFGPYVGIVWERRLGRSADLARQAGQDTGGFGLALGLRTWF